MNDGDSFIDYINNLVFEFLIFADIEMEFLPLLTRKCVSRLNDDKPVNMQIECVKTDI